MKWFIPSWNGDYRLEPTSKTTCQLLVVDPTPAEKDTLLAFLVTARERGWTTRKRLSTRSDSTTIPLKCSVTDAAPSLIAAGAAPSIGALTVLQFSNGEAHAEEDPQLIAKIAAEAEAADEEEKKPKAAATTKRPTSCCPSCIPGAIGPASEVLQAFLTPEQHRTWSGERYVTTQGHLTGHRYGIAHRHTPRAQRWGKVCRDLTEDFTLHFHDSSVPPEEEVLGALFMLQHREHWVRHEATVLGQSRVLFKNPFGNMGDGVADAVFTDQLGRLFQGMGNS